MPLSVQELSFYYEAMLQAGLSELEIDTVEGKIILKRCTAESMLREKAPSFLRRKTDLTPDPEIKQVPSGKLIASPLMGTFFRASSPKSPALVKEGDTVDAGVTLCIVEAMKVMNEIKSDCRCKILKIYAENGKAVTKGQPLFSYEPL